jgi:hypothetical protein
MVYKGIEITLARLCLRPTRHVDNSGSGRRLIDELW